MMACNEEVNCGSRCTSCFPMEDILSQISNVARSQILTAVDKLAIIKRLLDEYEEATGVDFND